MNRYVGIYFCCTFSVDEHCLARLDGTSVLGDRYWLTLPSSPPAASSTEREWFSAGIETVPLSLPTGELHFQIVHLQSIVSLVSEIARSTRTAVVVKIILKKEKESQSLVSRFWAQPAALFSLSNVRPQHCDSSQNPSVYYCVIWGGTVPGRSAVGGGRGQVYMYTRRDRQICCHRNGLP